MPEKGKLYKLNRNLLERLGYALALVSVIEKIGSAKPGYERDAYQKTKYEVPLNGEEVLLCLGEHYVFGPMLDASMAPIFLRKEKEIVIIPPEFVVEATS